MSFGLIEKFILVAINISGVLLGIWVIRSSTKNQLNRWFGLMTLLILLWVNFAFFGSIVDNYFTSLLFYKLNWASVALFLFVSYKFFVSYFLNESGKHKYLS